MATDIWREFDPNLDIPIGLKNARERRMPDATSTLADPDADYDFQDETPNDDDSNLDDDYIEEELDVPGTFTIVSQTVRNAPDGSQVVDVVVEVEDIVGALEYEIRITK